MSDNPYQPPATDPIAPEEPLLNLPRANPWRTYWTKPRETLRAMIANKQYGISMYFFVILEGMVLQGTMLASSGMDRLLMMRGASGDPANVVGFFLGMACSSGIIGYLLWLLLSTYATLWGNLFGGKGRMREVRCGLAWSAGVNLFILPFFLLFFLPPRVEGYPVLIVPLAILFLGLMIWKFVIAYRSVSEAHRFNWGFPTLLLANISVVITLVAFSFGLAAILDSQT